MKSSRIPKCPTSRLTQQMKAPVGGRRNPRPMDTPIRQGTRTPQCPSNSSLTIEEIETCPLESQDQQEMQVMRPSSKTINCMEIETLAETDSQMTCSTTEMFTTIANPQNYNNVTMIRRSEGNGDQASLENSATYPGFILKAIQTGWSFMNAKMMPYLIIGLLVFIFFFPMITSFIGLLLVYFFINSYISSSKPRSSSRTVKWTIQDFSEEIRSGFLTCPPFIDKSGQWRLVICQRRLMEGTQTSLGLIATNIPEDVGYVNADIKFSCQNILNQELCPGMSRQKVLHRYTRSGDCAYTRPIMFSRKQLGPPDTLKIIARIHFKTVGIGGRGMLLNLLGDKEKKGSRGQNVVEETGLVQQERLTYEDSFSSDMQSLTRFVQNPETKTFVWDIPNFNQLLKNRQIWGLFSPQFFVHSCTSTYDVCSIWRMKLIEVNGVFRLSVNLRGLPQNQNQVKVWYLLQLVDNFGDSVVPEHSVSRVKYPDLLNLWDTSRHILYRRETLLSRFLSIDGNLTLRLSLQVQPNEIPLLEADSDIWLLKSSQTNVQK